MCPDHATSDAGTASLLGCRCEAGYYNALPAGSHDIECVPCVTGSDCPEASEVTIETLPLSRGFYRTSNVSEDLRRCPDFGNTSGCVGGVGEGEGPCKPWLAGPYCRLCNVTDTSRYYDADESECALCEGSATLPAIIVAVLTVILIAFALLCARFKPHRKLRGLARLSDSMQRTSAQLSLHAKGKQLLGFYQVATRISAVYEVPMPKEVAALLSFFEVLNINIAGIGLPLQCLGLGTYQQQLLTTMLVPVGVTVLLVLGFLVRSFCVSKEKRLSKWLVAGLVASLPWLLPLSFLAFPMVSSPRSSPFRARLSTMAACSCAPTMPSSAAPTCTSSPNQRHGLASSSTPSASRCSTWASSGAHVMPS